MLNLYFDWLGPHQHVPNGMVPGDLTTEYSQGVYQNYGNSETAHHMIMHQHENLFYHAGFMSYLNHFKIPYKTLPILTMREDDRGLFLMEPYGGCQRMFGGKGGNSLGLEFPRLVSSLALDLLRQCHLWVAFNYTLEGFTFNPWAWENIAQALTKVGVPLSQVIIINGNVIETQEKMEEWALSSGNEPMHIVSYGVSEDLFRIHIRHDQRDYPDRVWLDHAQRTPAMIRPHKYLCMNRRPHPHRTALVVGLMYRSLLSQGAVSFPNKNEWGDPRAQGAAYWTDKRLYWRHAEKLMDAPPLRIDQPDITAQYMDYTDSHLFEDSYFSLITETLFSNDSIFPTEKTFRAISQWHPFIIVGNYQFLQHLRTLGYRTFSPLIDESYDQEKDQCKRMDMILDEVERLCKMNQHEFGLWYQSMLPIYQHNADHLLGDRPMGIHNMGAQLEDIVAGVS